MPRGKPVTRQSLMELPAGTELLRDVRYASDAELADITDEELERGARWLRAAAYSATEGARTFERALYHRHAPNTESTPEP